MEFYGISKVRMPVYMLVLAFLFLALPQQALSAKLSAPQAEIQKLSDRMQRSLKGKPSAGRVYSLVNQILVPKVNFHLLSKRAVGKKYWNKASSGQKSRFIAQFKRMMVRTYGSVFANYRNWSMKHTGVKVKGKSAAVRTRITPSGASSVNVVYLMYRGKGGWRVYDIIISGVSLAKSHTASFQSIAKRSGMEGLIKRLRAMNKKR